MKIFPRFLALQIGSCILLAVGAQEGLAAPPAGYSLVWSDEFNGAVGSAPSATWNYNLGDSGWGNSELENYTNSTANSQIVSDPNATDGKALAIIALDPGGNNGQVGSYTSARINTFGNFSFQYGYIEARIQLPTGQGMWPTFWMLGNDFYTGGYNASSPTGNWPNCGEVDIAESISNSNPSPATNVSGATWQSTIDTALHMPGHSGSGGLISYWALPGGQIYAAGYHLFAAQWTPGQMQIFMDGNLVESHSSADVSAGQWVFDAGPFFILLNTAVGGDYPGSPDSTTSFPQTMLVDYVRVYQAASGSTPTPTPTLLPGLTPSPTTTPASPTATAVSSTASSSPYIYPDPIRGGQANLHCNMIGSGRMDLKIYNLAGELVATFDQTEPAGTQIIGLNLSGLVSGVYFYTLQIDYDSGQVDQEPARKFILLR